MAQDQEEAKVTKESLISMIWRGIGSLAPNLNAEYRHRTQAQAHSIVASLKEESREENNDAD